MSQAPSQLPLLTHDLAALRSLMGQLSDPLLLLNAGLQVLEANTSAYRLLGLQADRSLQSLRTGSGGRLQDWLRQATLALDGGRRAPATPTLALADGGRAQLSLLALQGDDAARWLLHAQPVAGKPGRTPRPAAAKSLEALDTADAGNEPPAPPLASDAPAWAGELLQIFWSSPFPAFVLDARLQLQAVNPAFAELCGQTSEALAGRSLGELLGASERARLMAPSRPATPPIEFRLRDALGHERSMRSTPHLISAPGQATLTLCVLQDCTAELAAREQAERAQAEMAQWFELSPLPMVLFDESGLLLRSNSAFAALSLSPPATLHEASPELQHLLAWSQHQPLPALQQAHASGQPLVTQAVLIEPGGTTRWLQGRLRPVASLGGSQRRYMAVLEDRSLEHERDLAHQQLDALMDTAGVGLATFQQDAGWLRPRAVKSSGSGRNSLAGLQGVSRDIVEPGSLPEFERLQKALKNGDRIEVRYAVRHPELGRRWLLTRVEPGKLASGQRTTSVVTLDLSAQHQAERRSEQLLRELTTIMDGASLGLAYLRGAQLLRCNRGFEEMLGLPDAVVAGTPVAQLFAALPDLRQQVLTALPRLADKPFETEFVQVGRPRWLSLSLRPVAVGAEEQPETIVVISDISRLKTQQAELENLVQDRELMFSLSDVGMAILRQGHIERANEALASMSDYRIHELNTLEHSQLFESPEAYRHLHAEMQAALAEVGQWRGERRLRRRDGSLLWVQVSKRVMRPGAVDAGVIATYVNVDERWRAQQSLMLQTERERAVLDSVLVGIVTVGRGGIEWMNRSARRMFGGDLATFAGQPISLVATPEAEHPFRRNRYLDELAEGQADTFECRLRGLDGREFWVVGNAVVTGDEASGRQITYALLDIERRRQAEAQTLQAQASLRRIIEAAPLAISLFDAKTLQLEQTNQAAAALAGRSEAELLGTTPETMFGPEQGAVVRQDMEAALQVDAVTQREYRFDLDGQPRLWDARYLHLAGIAGPDGQTEPEQLLLVASDVTEQRAAAEARLAAAIAQRELLVKEVHHRIKNNLQGVAGLLQQIASRRPEVAGVIGEAVGQVQAIAQVYGLQVGSTGPLRVRSVVEAIVGSVQRMSGRSIHFEIEDASAKLAHRWALPEAESIPIALTLNELLGNAIKHGGEQSPVSCALVCEPGRVLLRISNAGQLPEGFELARVPGGVSGLGLVRALLPRRSAKLSLAQQGAQVLCSVELLPPSITLLEPL